MPDLSLPIIPEKFSLTPEFRLLAACSWIAPSHLESFQAEKIVALCNSDVNWNGFLSLVFMHGVQPQVYATFRKFAHDRVPKIIFEKLREQKILVSQNMLYFSAELMRLLQLFTRNGIDSIPLKGIALSLQLYGDPGMRSSSDIDIMVKPHDLDRTCQILEAEGYQCAVFGQKMTKRQKEYVRKNFYHIEYYNLEKRLCVELHWAFGSLWLPEQTSLVWRNLKPFDWMGTSINIIDDNFLLLILCDHGVRHRFCCLKWLSDIVKLISGSSVINWEKLIEISESLDLNRTLAHSGLIIYWVYGIPLPDRLQSLIKNDKTSAKISSKVFELLTSNVAGSVFSGSRLGGLGLAWQIKRIRPSIPLYRLFKSNLLHPIDFQFIRLPDFLFWLYYPLRPLLGLWRLYFRK